LEWDSTISLAFAAEHLFQAAQLLTSDIVPWNRALRVAYDRHMVPLLENDSLLPGEIREKLLAVQRSYVNAKATGMSRDFARQLGSELMKILTEITATLNRVSGSSFWRIDPQAA
jgi:hypothetical protein